MFGPPTPILRSFDERRAKRFYVDFLGFEIVFEHRFEPELIEIHRIGALVVRFVHGQQNRQTRLPQLARNRLVAGDEPFASIDQKHEKVGPLDRELSLFHHQLVEWILTGAVQTARINELERRSPPLDWPRQGVPGRTRNWGDDRAS